MAHRSPTAVSKVMCHHSRFVSLLEVRVYEGDLEMNAKNHFEECQMKNKPRKPQNNCLRNKKLPVGGETGESLAADGVTICCGCDDATVPFVCVPFVCEDCCGV
jgi:hypothetical protein